MLEMMDSSVGYNFSISENQEMIRKMVKDFAEKNIRANVMEWDEAQHFPVEIFKKLGELGLMGVLVPEIYGGSGFGYQEYVDVCV
jgi:alkylation response protein AidB-like acyl-CoA dehydrogenase